MITTWLASWTSVRTAASAQFLLAGPELAPEPLVLRVSDRPPTEAVVDADTTVVPTDDETSVIEQLPVPPVVVHGFGVVKLPGPDTIVKLIDVPSGAGTKPVPGFTFTCAVNTWLAPTGFSADSGEIWMFASTQVLFALPEPPGPGFVAVVRGIVCPFTGMLEVAETTVVPGVVELIVTVQLAVAAPPV